MTVILKVNPSSPEKSRIRRAARIIKNGGLVAFPTETVYGLGADATNADAARRIFKAKKRPADNPLIVHVASIRQAGRIAVMTPDAMRLAKRLWPGPLTMLLKKKEAVPKIVTAGKEYVAVRMPSNRVALELIRASRTPIAAPSANLSGRPSPTSAAHVIQDLDGRLDMVLDGGSTKHGVESTILDMTTSKPAILREGPYTKELLGRYVKLAQNPGSGTTKVVPGAKYRHYSPDTPMVMVGRARLSEYACAASKRSKVCVICSSESAVRLPKACTSISLGSGRDMRGIARRLFSSFRKLDSIGADICLVETFRERGLGRAVMNRMRKACNGVEISSRASLKSMLAGLHAREPRT